MGKFTNGNHARARHDHRLDFEPGATAGPGRYRAARNLEAVQAARPLKPLGPPAGMPPKDATPEPEVPMDMGSSIRMLEALLHPGRVGKLKDKQVVAFESMLAHAREKGWLSFRQREWIGDAYQRTS